MTLSRPHPRTPPYPENTVLVQGPTHPQISVTLGKCILKNKPIPINRSQITENKLHTHDLRSAPHTQPVSDVCTMYSKPQSTLPQDPFFFIIGLKTPELRTDYCVRSVLRLFYGCSYRFHLSGDNSRYRTENIFV